MSETESFRFLFFSDLLGKKVVGADGAVVGKVADLVIATGEPYPPVESLVVRSKRGPLQLPWSAVAAMDGEVRLHAEARRAPPPEAPVADRVRLTEEVLENTWTKTSTAIQPGLTRPADFTAREDAVPPLPVDASSMRAASSHEGRRALQSKRLRAPRARGATGRPAP
jgi:sporulation protein YlmC with PRC-barrel domain